MGSSPTAERSRHGQQFPATPASHDDRLRPELAAAAGYLGLSEPELRGRLLAGDTLRELAEERARPMERLVQTMVDIGRARLEAAARSGAITQAQVDEIVADLRRRVEWGARVRSPRRVAGLTRRAAALGTASATALRSAQSTPGRSGP